MRTNYRPADTQQRLTLAMTPMIDVVFLLLIFFVCTASFQPVEESLPSEVVVSGAGSIEAPTEPTPELDEVVIRVMRREGRTAWLVNEAPCPSLDRLAQMLEALVEIDPSLPVIVDPDGAAPISDVVKAYDLSRGVGFTTVRFAASAE